MSDVLIRNSNSITISEFFEQYQLGKFNMTPKYQRKSVWTEEKKSFLMDSILRNFPMPPIFLRKNVDLKTGKTSFDVIDAYFGTSSPSETADRGH